MPILKKRGLTKFLVVVALVAAAGIGWYIWKQEQAAAVPRGIAFGNGRIEATEVDVAAKQQGRVEAVLVQEGDMVKEAQLLARMDSEVLQAQLEEAEAGKLKAETDRNVNVAVVGQRESELDLARKILNRSRQLFQQKSLEQNQLDKDQASEQTAKAVLEAAKAQVASADAAIASAAAKIDKVKADIADTILKSPRNGRVEYRLVEPGEVIPAGGNVVTLLDVSDVYMTFFLPDERSGQGRSGRRCAHHSGCQARSSHSGEGFVCFANRAVHAERSRDAERAREVDVPGQSPD